jgi:hypothetical protein
MPSSVRAGLTRSGIVPVRALPRLRDEAKKGDDTATAVVNLVATWWHWAELAMDAGAIVGCAGCAKVLNEKKVGGFAVLLPHPLVRGSEPMGGHCAAFCLRCISRRPSQELRDAFAKTLESEGFGSLSRLA